MTLQLNDELDYRNVLGNTNGIIPSKIIGRGLIKLDKVVEFQTAYVSNKDTLYDDIKTYCVKLFMTIKMKARPIPVLPEQVSFSDISRNEISISSIPVGLIKKNLGVSNINLKEIISYLISSRSFDDIIPFIDKFLYVLSNSNINTFVFDTKFIYEENKFSNIQYLNSDFISSLEKINDYAEQIHNVLEQTSFNKRSIKDVKDVICVIIGLDKFIKGLKEDEKKLFDNIISKTKESTKIHFVFIDSAGSLKKCEFESWYKDTVDSSSGLWIGDGFAEQYSIKPTKLEQKYYDLVGNSYGYIVSNGSVDFIKVIEKE